MECWADQALTKNCCLAFAGLQGHRHWEKILEADNQSKKEWKSPNALPSRYSDLIRCEIIQRAGGAEEIMNTSEVLVEAERKTSNTKCVQVNMCYQMEKCEKQYQ